MQSPVLCERVRVPGHDAAYFVVSIDEQERVVNLVPVSGHGPSLEAVPFSELFRRAFTHPDSSECCPHSAGQRDLI
jgi:hypothetical protein